MLTLSLFLTDKWNNFPLTRYSNLPPEFPLSTVPISHTEVQWSLPASWRFEVRKDQLSPFFPLFPVSFFWSEPNCTFSNTFSFLTFSKASPHTVWLLVSCMWPQGWLNQHGFFLFFLLCSPLGSCLYVNILVVSVLSSSKIVPELPFDSILSSWFQKFQSVMAGREHSWVEPFRSLWSGSREKVSGEIPGQDVTPRYSQCPTDS